MAKMIVSWRMSDELIKKMELETLRKYSWHQKDTFEIPDETARKLIEHGAHLSEDETVEFDLQWIDRRHWEGDGTPIYWHVKNSNEPFVMDVMLTAELAVDKFFEKVKTETEDKKQVEELRPKKEEINKKTNEEIEKEEKEKSEKRKKENEEKEKKEKEKKEKFLTEASEWVKEHGSERLQLALKNKLLGQCTGAYRTERMEFELGSGWRLVNPKLYITDAINPSLEALVALENAKDNPAIEDPELAFFTDTDEYGDEETFQGVWAIHLGREVYFRV